MVDGLVFDQKAAKAAGGPSRMEKAKVGGLMAAKAAGGPSKMEEAKVGRWQ